MSPSLTWFSISFSLSHLSHLSLPLFSSLLCQGAARRAGSGGTIHLTHSTSTWQQLKERPEEKIVEVDF